MKQMGKFIGNLLWLLAAGFVLTFLLEWLYFDADTAAFLTFFFKHEAVFGLSSVLLFLLEVIVWALGCGPVLTVGLFAGTILTVAYANHVKYAYRGIPLLPEDLFQLDQSGIIVNFVNKGQVAWVLVGVIALIAASAWGEHRCRRWRGWGQCHRRRDLCRQILFRLVIICLCIGVFYHLTSFVWAHSGGRDEAIEALDTKFVAWNQNSNYNNVGFLLGFLYNLKKFSLEAPPDYSRERIAGIYAYYAELQNADRGGRTSLADADYNIVMVLNESFYDPEKMRAYYQLDAPQDLAPYLHAIQARYPHGEMYSTDYGGGTANIEFEALTGLSNFWADVVPYVSILPKYPAMPSIASWVKRGGYQTLALHPYNGGMYKRYLVLEREGFDEFLEEKAFEQAERDEVSEYVTDQAAYERVWTELRQRDSKQLVFLITMQNHSPYDDFNRHQEFVHVANPAGEEQVFTEGFIEKFVRSDAATGAWIAQLEAFEELTVVLFFGDHAPGVLHEMHDDPEPAIYTQTKLTPYFVAANFPLPGASEAAALLPTTSPNCLANTLYNLLQLEKPVSAYLLDDLCAAQPVLSKRYFETHELSTEPVVTDYELLNYDLLGGEQYWLTLDGD